MRRAVPAVAATILGLVALASFNSSPIRATRSATARTAKPTTPAATAPPHDPGTTTPPGPSPATSPATSPASTPATNPPATNPPSNVTRTIDGDPFDNQYGTVQVRVTLQGSQITGITAIQMPFDHQRSAEISQQAEPLLRQEALQAQSAQIDIIGGATYTTEGYAQSLQSALDKAGK